MTKAQHQLSVLLFINQKENQNYCTDDDVEFRFHFLSVSTTVYLALYSTIESNVFNDVASAHREYPGTFTTYESSSYELVIP